MSILQAIILGLIQGLTEFIPISSSGHLVIAHEVLGITESGLAFDVALHLGTLIALVAFFWRDLLQYVPALFRKNDKTKLAWLLLAATLPAAFAGYLLESKAESQFRSVRLVAFNMLLLGAVMLVAEHFYSRQKRHTKLADVDARQALTMGLAQALAIVPGISRSGSTITAGLFAGLDRVSATRFAFLLGIPITAGAILKIFSRGEILSQFQAEQGAVIAGILAALLSGLFAIRFMLRYLSGHGLQIFAYYRLAVGAALLLVFSL